MTLFPYRARLMSTLRVPGGRLFSEMRHLRLVSDAWLWRAMAAGLVAPSSRVAATAFFVWVMPFWLKNVITLREEGVAASKKGTAVWRRDVAVPIEAAAALLKDAAPWQKDAAVVQEDVAVAPKAAVARERVAAMTRTAGVERERVAAGWRGDAASGRDAGVFFSFDRSAPPLTPEEGDAVG